MNSPHLMRSKSAGFKLGNLNSQLQLFCSTALSYLDNIEYSDSYTVSPSLVSTYVRIRISVPIGMRGGHEIILG